MDGETLGSREDVAVDGDGWGALGALGRGPIHAIRPYAA